MLKVQNLSVSFAGKEVFNDINFIINPNEKIGLIGRNGCGKTTLFKILADQIKDFDGKITKSDSYRIGYLQQHLKFTEQTVIDEACTALPDYKEGFVWDAERILSQLEFSEEDKLRNPQEFSGGWQIRLNLAKLLISEPDLLLLDEPTNYLDIISIRWLKQFLKNYNGAILIITHDRDFMDDIISHTMIIHRGTTIKIDGNTKDMYRKIEEDEQNYEKTRLNVKKKREQVQKWIDRFGAKATLASQAKSKEKMLNKMDDRDELQDIKSLDFNFKCREFTGNSNMMDVKNLAFRYSVDYAPLFQKLSFRVEKGDRICIIGRNGKGKSTLLRVLNEMLQPLEGEVWKNQKTEIGYFGQMNIDNLNLNHTIEQELQSVDMILPRGQILATAGKMLFTGGDTQKKVAMLSGGEKSRVMLGKILLKPCNLLLLDEPTNHLDMESCEALMEAIEEFDGASITVSHHEHLLNNIANRLIIFDNNECSFFEGNYQDFLKKVGWDEKKE
ncbi:MAG: ATP-binding cassette domain-containing protein [Rickettsiales bacterium]|jgi:ATP-binding cassette subfamily F protein 3|nr:ATP-binding cassette domain-containing protein [Rickettsiales bacterium]